MQKRKDEFGTGHKNLIRKEQGGRESAHPTKLLKEKKDEKQTDCLLD